MPAYLLIAAAIALSLDAAALAIARGMVRRPSLAQAAGFGLLCGIFQAVLLGLGWWLCVGAQGWIAGNDRWLASVLLAAIGAKMLWEAASGSIVAEAVAGWPTWRAALGLAVLTSLDAAAAGVGLATLGNDPLMAAIVVGAVTLLAVVVGARWADAFGGRGVRGLEAFGGGLLIAIGGWLLLAPSA